MSTDKTVAKLMALADAYVEAEFDRLGRRVALEQAIRRAVDWEQVAELRGDMKGGGHVHWLSDKTFEPGTPLYARNKP